MLKKQNTMLWVLVLLLVVAGVAIRFRPAAHVELSEIHDANLPTLLELGASWCPPCKAMKPVLAELQGDYRGFNVRYVDVEKDAATARKYNVSGIPLIVFLDAEGNTLQTQVGYMSRDKILSTWGQLGVDVTKVD